MRRLPVAEVGTRGLDYLREANHGDQFVGRDRLSVDLFEELDLLLESAELRVVVLNITRGELGDPLHLDIVDHGGEDLLARAVPKANGDPDDLATLVLVALVAKPDRRRLATALELVDEDRRVEVENIDTAAHRQRAYLTAPVPSLALG